MKRLGLTLLIYALFWTSVASSQDSLCQGPIQEVDLAACRENVDWLIRYAHWLSNRNRYEEAADQLERLLMLYPLYPQATELYQQALTNINTQDIFLPRTTEKSEATKNHSEGLTLYVREGYSSNLNRAPLQRNINLTFPAQTLVVDLSPQFRQQAGSATEIYLRTNTEKTLTNNLQWRVNGEIMARESAYDGYASYQGINLASSAIYTQESGSQYSASLVVNEMHYANDINVYAVQSQLHGHWGVSALCKTEAGADLLWQQQYKVSNLDSHYSGFMTGVFCQIDSNLVGFVLAGGRDWAIGQRPGGDQWRANLQLFGFWPLTAIHPNSLLKTRATYLYADDTESYSPLLSQGAKRQNNRYELGVDFEYPLDSILHNLKTVTSATWQKQDSNIGLFQINVIEVWGGVKIVW